LSADWETLNADKSDWESEYPDPQFLGAWRKHREIYGYMLRSELVYQLKKSMEQNPDFTIEQLYKHILIDEYQDLNKCDLEIIKKLANSGIFIYACGDDDQSIYGFRFAYPQGIRMFNQEYDPCEILLLENCIRCGENILKLALFIANLDNTRLQKTIISYNQEQPGEVNLLNFPNESEEAKYIAKLCKYFIDIKGVIPKDILILTRNDRHGVFSSILKEALDNIGIPVATQANIESILDKKEARVFLSILRLLVNPRDQLAWLSILKIRNNGIGEKTISKIYEFAVDQGITFVDSFIQIINSPGTLDVNVGLLIDEYKYINDIINKYRDVVTISMEEIISLVTDIANDLINDEAIRVDVVNYLTTIINTSEVEDLQELLIAMSTSLDDKEQDIDDCCVNIMTMHKAKGLSAEVVFIIAAEDEYLPGTQTGAEEGDARRLLYVSLTRAKKYLYITYCCERIGRQRFTGSKPNTTRRTLSRFLIDAPLTPENGLEYTQKLTN
jgi:DNA helicase-2/ATP-dependent DNA helicase PcrA